MPQVNLIVDLALAIGLALLGGVIAVRLRQPAIVGYLLAGVVLSPYTPGPIPGDVERVQTLAELGVAFLMFGLGAEFSLEDLRRVGPVGALGGSLQIAGTIALGLLVAPLLGLDTVRGLFFGALIALSSTAVATRLLDARGELHALHGRVALAILILQDLSVVPMMVLLPALAEPADSLLLTLGGAVARAALLLVATYVLGTRLVPWLLARVAATRSRELFLLAVVTLALGTALGARALGLSLAFGAFLGGLVVSESDLSHQVVAEILPLRDVFATLFFVSVGMLLDPAFLVANLGAVLVVGVVIVVGKALISTGATLLFGFAGPPALLAGLALAQIGEFSFVLAQLGLQRGIVDDRLYGLTLAGALVTMLASPALLQAGPKLAAGLARTPGLRRLFAEPVVGAAGPELHGHVVIAGFGRVGRELAEALERREFAFVVVEYDPHVVDELRKRGIAVIYGDASNAQVLARAGIERARVLAVTLPDPVSSELAVRRARALNPRLDVVARAHGREGLARLRSAGATEVVQPEFEAGLEFIRHTLHRFGVSSVEIQALVARRRERYYEAPGPE